MEYKLQHLYEIYGKAQSGTQWKCCMCSVRCVFSLQRPLTAAQAPCAAVSTGGTKLRRAGVN